jgi:hypothetical protein
MHQSLGGRRGTALWWLVAYPIPDVKPQVKPLLIRTLRRAAPVGYRGEAQRTRRCTHANIRFCRIERVCGVRKPIPQRTPDDADKPGYRIDLVYDLRFLR